MDPSGTATPGRRVRQIEEAVMLVDGVLRVRVWEMGAKLEIGVEVAPQDAVGDVLHRVREATEAMRGPEEEWDVGVLTE